jgi:transcriptional regulator with XRE-family HTH domain
LQTRLLMPEYNKSGRAALFRDRLALALGDAGLSRADLARRTGVDRSTVTQLLAPGSVRLPNAQVIAECAAALSVSADWLLGLSERPERAGDLLDTDFAMTEAPRSAVDEQIFAWHREAAGRKIRHVPASLPDLLKTEALLRWEYASHVSRTPEQAVGAAADRLDWMRGADSDYEIAMPAYELGSFAHGTGYYDGVTTELRAAQLAHFAHLCEQLYPRLRIFLFDARQVFSAPVTIFGAQMAALYTGGHYIVFRDAVRVRRLIGNFDQLIREATVDARDFPAHVADLRRQIPRS